MIADEARHVHFGVLALDECYTRDLGEAERRDRQDWAFEMALLLRNRFLVHEFYEELGLLAYESLPAAPEPTADDLLRD